MEAPISAVDFWKEIKAFSDFSGISINKLAKRVGMHPATLYGFRAARWNPRRETVERVRLYMQQAERMIHARKANGKAKESSAMQDAPTLHNSQDSLASIKEILNGGFSDAVKIKLLHSLLS